MTGFEVIERNTGRKIVLQTLRDAQGNYLPYDPEWQADYYLCEPGTTDEIQMRPATEADELRDRADALRIVAAELDEIADRMDGGIEDDS